MKNVKEERVFGGLLIVSTILFALIAAAICSGAAQ